MSNSNKPPSVESGRGLDPDSLRTLSKPLVSLAMKYGFSIQEVVEITKRAFISVAEDQLVEDETKVNISRLSVMTGLYRAEVERLYVDQTPLEDRPMSIMGQVIENWRHNPKYKGKSGQPKVLPLKGKKYDFESLVGLVTKSLNSGTVLFEMKRLGYVEETPKGLKLLRHTAGFQSDPKGGFELLAQEIKTLISAVDENLLGEQPVSNMHIRTVYDDIVIDQLPKIRKWLIAEAKVFHQKVRDYLAKHDRELNPALKKQLGGGEVSVSSFSLAPIPKTRRIGTSAKSKKRRNIK